MGNSHQNRPKKSGFFNFGIQNNFSCHHKSGMGPEACSADGERLVRCVARKMAAKHQFVKSDSLNKTMGPAVSKVLNRGYSLPFQFDGQ